jgi:hypothetical protein
VQPVIYGCSVPRLTPQLAHFALQASMSILFPRLF